MKEETVRDDGPEGLSDADEGVAVRAPADPRRAGATVTESSIGGVAAAPRLSSRLWILTAVACVAAAAVFWWHGRAEAAFVAAALGVVCWFLNQRGDFKRIRDENENTESDAAEWDDPSDDG